jgi:adenosylhomocysteine nucleosidase
MPNPMIAIITALKEELAAVQAGIPESAHSSVLFVRGGVGWDSAEAAVKKIVTSQSVPLLICSSGFCGGLSPELAVGDIVLPDRLTGLGLGEKYAITFDGPEVGERSFGVVMNALRDAFTAANIKHHAGAMVSVRAPVTQTKEKHKLGVDRKAVAVDMESFAIADNAFRKAPVFVLRAVSDSVDDELPPEVGGFLDESGDVRVGNVAKFVIGGPKNVKTLWDLKARTDKANASLTAAWKAAWPVIAGISDLEKKPL